MGKGVYYKMKGELPLFQIIAYKNILLDFLDNSTDPLLFEEVEILQNADQSENPYENEMLPYQEISNEMDDNESKDKNKIASESQIHNLISKANDLLNKTQLEMPPIIKTADLKSNQNIEFPQEFDKNSVSPSIMIKPLKNTIPVAITEQI